MSAGMHSSGSTWLYNTLRYMFILDQRDVYGSFAGRCYDDSRNEDIHVVKTHTGNHIKFDYAFMTKRDLRNIIASAIRRGFILETETEVVAYLNRLVHKEYYPWKNKVNLEIAYEDLDGKKDFYVDEIAKIIGIKVNAHDVCAAVDGLKPGPVGTGVTIEPNHRGKNKTNYRYSLSPKTIELIQNKFGDYLVDLGYVI